MADNNRKTHPVPMKAEGKLSFTQSGVYAFFIPDDGSGDIRLLSRDTEGALDGDRVLVEITGDAFNRSCRVLEILERANTTLVAVVGKKSGHYHSLVADNRKIHTKILVHRSDLQGARVGERVVCEIFRYNDDGIPYAKVVKRLGDSESLASYVGGILEENRIRQVFSRKAIAQADGIEDFARLEDIGNRLDLRDEVIFTIDGDDAKDFDDAIGVERIDGGYRLGVHIADVSHYVTDGSPLDREALKRGTSVYFPGRVIPMLPKRLSDGVCSLVEGKDRLTLSVIMDIDSNGKVFGYDIRESVIRSKRRMTYSNAEKMLDGDPILCEKYADILPVLKMADELAGILNRKREKRGSINFDFPEAEIRLNKAGEPVSVEASQRLRTHKLIEEFMLIANETVAEYACRLEIPFVYRVHEAPDVEKIRELNTFLNRFGIGIKGRFDKDTPLHPMEYAKILSGVDEEILPIISKTMLRSMPKAEYKPRNMGHFGLSAEFYCHFTSPIRRYPDLMIHRILKELLNGGDCEKFLRKTQVASKISSETERAAELCERDCDDLYKTAYISRFIGQELVGKISSITQFGIYVNLSNCIEGMIRLDSMKDDYYIFDEKSQSVVGRRKNKCYNIGDELEVVTVNTDLLARHIDFVRSEDYFKRLTKVKKWRNSR